MALKDDPEMADFFEAIKTEGPSALAKFWNDPEFLKKFGSRVAPVASANPAMQVSETGSASARVWSLRVERIRLHRGSTTREFGCGR